ncbi:MAG TPA: DUF4411 family protein [Candidatus Dojkabacteria bacterium]|nr:DUF4411 family protein [Candidatus Dojkabacteria bacterium]
MNKYLLDTNAYIEIDRGASVDMFPTTLWASIGDSIKKGEILLLKAVYNEVTKSSDGLSSWMKGYSDFIYDHLADIDLIARAKIIVNKYPTIVDPKNINDQADPYIIACAYEKSLCIVTNEGRKHSKINIPYICDEYNINCIQSYEFMRNTGWKF